MVRIVAGALLLLVVAFVPFSWKSQGIRVGSKKFTESIVLGEMLSQLMSDQGPVTTHYRELGGTQLVFQALLNGDIDLYPEYTGTITAEILTGKDAKGLPAMRNMLAGKGVWMSEPIGFNNTYALGMLKSRARELNISRISDLIRYPDLKFGFSNEFMDRVDGWPNLQRRYVLPQREVRGLDHDLAYRQLRLEAVDLIDVYTTDAKIERFDLAVLEDDLDFFPRYDAVILARSDFAEKYPEMIEKIQRIEGRVSPEEMRAMNGRVELDRASESRVAAEFLAKRFDIVNSVMESGVASQVWARTVEHLDLVRKSLIPAILISIPLGVCAARYRALGHFVLAFVGIIQTIPSLALLVGLMPLMAWLGLSSIGLGASTAVTALFLYSLLPIVRNTFTGLKSVAGEYQESAASLGLPASLRLMKIELPLASRSILAGIKTAAVINVGFATLGALIGAGGYGQPIITGIRLNDTMLVLQGAIPAAVLALLVQGLFELAEVYLVPKGLRLAVKH